MIRGKSVGPRFVILLGLCFVTVSGSTRAADPAGRLEQSVAYVELPSPVSDEYIGSSSNGTGFVIASDAQSSYILTAAHVAGCDTYGAGCQPKLDIRFADDPKAISGEVVYAGASNAAEDYAVVRIPRPNLHAVTLGDANTSENVSELGYPDAPKRPIPSQLPAVQRQGTISRVVDGGARLLMQIATTHGDSGAPIFDASSGAVVGLVHGASGDDPNAERFALGPKQLHYITALVADSIKKSHGNDNAVAARLLFLNALAIASHYNFLFSNLADFMSAQMTTLSATQSDLFVRAIRGGSLEAAEYVVTSSIQMDIMISQGGVLERLDAAAQKGNGDADFALYKYFWQQVAHPESFESLPKSNDPQKDALRYLHRAIQRGNPFAMDELSHEYSGFGLLGVPKDSRMEKTWRSKADSGLEILANRGNAAAALLRAHNYESFESGPATLNRSRLLSYLRKAADLGSTEASSDLVLWLLSGASPQGVDEAFLRAKKAVDNGASGPIAKQLGEMYEQGKGTPVDRDKALAAYARSDNLNQKLVALTPNGQATEAALTSSKGYLAAAATAARIDVPMQDPLFPRSGTTVANGIVVKSDGRTAVVATAAFNLNCDSFGDKCITPSSIEVGSNRTKYENVRIARYADTSVENGVVLLQVDAPNAFPAELSTTIPSVVMTAASFGTTSRTSADGKALLGKASWGVVLGSSPDHRVLDLALRPAESWGWMIGAGIFDLATGQLVGIYTDPYNILHASGPATIQQALREATLR